MDWQKAHYSDVMAEASAGKLTLDEFLTYSRFGLGSQNNGTSDYLTLDRAKALLNTLKSTEPSNSVTAYVQKGVTGDGQGLTQWLNDSKEVIAPKLPGINDVVPQLGSVTDFLKGLTQPQLWIRIAEFSIGIVLIAIGLASISGTGNVISKAVKARI